MTSSSNLTKTWLAALSLLAALFGAAPVAAEATDILGPSDTVRVTILQNPDLSTEGRLSAQGSLRMPLIGNIDLNGLSTDAAADRVAQRYQDGQFLKDPQVTVTIMQVRSRQVSVLGQVARPGRYAIDDTSTRVTDMLALAGGIIPGGDDVVTVVTKRDGQPKKFTINLVDMYRSADIDANVELVTGDMIFVQRAPVFYIYGEVQKAGAYRLDGNLNVMQAISLGGGITPRGTERGMKIHRRAADGSLAKIDVRPSDVIQADDVVYVSESLF
jgi:polysaccharide export outer membrane protein